MTLRTRLLLMLVGLVAAGLVVTDVVTYTQLRSFMVQRIEPQLEAAYFPASRELAAVNQIRLPGAVFRSGTAAGKVLRVGSGDRSSTEVAGGGVGGITANPRPRAEHHRHRLSFAFPGPALYTVAELVRKDGRVYGHAIPFYSGDKPAPPPILPDPLPTGSGSPVFFSAKSTGNTAYQVLARPLGAAGLTVVIGIPLTEVTQTTGHLLWIEILVSALVLAGLGVLAWWIVRRGLRPLQDMATTAGSIARGQLGLRVAPAEEHTEVGRLGLALNAMLGEIEQAFAARAASEGRLRRFLADASHELRTPLTTIRGHAELFELGSAQHPEDLAISMRHIKEEARRMNLLVDDLLLLARLDQQRPLEPAPADLVALCRRAVAGVEVLSPSYQLHLEAPPQLVVTCDAERIHQMVDNLLGNAVRHSPAGSPVVLRLRSEGTTAVIEVSDRGPGVAPEDAERIFEPFFRADFARARATGGAGLGLAIVASIVEAHGGSVGVRPGEGGGACFWVRLPANGRSGSPPEPSPGRPA